MNFHLDAGMYKGETPNTGGETKLKSTEAFHEQTHFQKLVSALITLSTTFYSRIKMYVVLDFTYTVTKFHHIGRKT